MSKVSYKVYEKPKKIVNSEFNNLFFLFHEQKVERAPRKTQINNRYL